MDKKELKFEDSYRHLHDKVHMGAGMKPRGHVQIFDKLANGEKKLIDKSNLVVYSGREWLARKAFTEPSVDPTADENLFISWFGTGTGGALAADVLTPKAPQNIDTDLSTSAIIDSSNPLYGNAGKLKPFTNLVFDEDTSNDNRQLIVTVETILGLNDANGPDGTTHYNLSEAGLYISNDNDPGSLDLGSLKLFSRVTFSTIRKESTRQLVFLWSIFF